MSIDNVAAPVSPVGVASSVTNVTAMDNFVGCTPAPTIGIASTSTQFSATAGSTCSTETNSDGTGTALHPFTGSNFPVTVNFTPTSAGPQTATLTLTDTTNGGTGTSAVTGTGKETAQTIAFTAPTATTYTFGAAPITLAATGGGSANPIVFTVDAASTGSGTISGNTLTITGAGSLIIDANELGGLVKGVFYAPATQAQLALTVNKAAQALSFSALASPVAFSNGLAISLSATGGGSGNAVVFTIDSTSTGTATITGSTLNVTGVGTLVIDANQAGNSNYTAAIQVQQTVKVNQGAQTITLTPPTPPIYFIVGGIAINLVGTGGGSGNAIVYSVDKSSTGAGTIAGSVLSVTAQGNLVIDANQAGNSNFLAAPQVQETIVIKPPLPTQTIAFPNPGTQVAATTLTLSATATSGFAVSYSSSTTTVCTVSGTKATFVAAGTCTITATQPGDNATFAAAPPVTISFLVNAAGVIPSFNFNLSLPNLTVQAGTVGTSTLTLNSVNQFTGSVILACTGLPSGYSCVFNPNPLTVLPNAGAVTTLSVVPSTPVAALRTDSRPFLPAASLAAALCFLGFRRRKRLQMLLILVIGFAGLGLFSGCGSNTSSIAASTSTVTVTATYGTQSVTQTFKLTVE